MSPPKSKRQSKERPPHQLGPFTWGPQAAEPSPETNDADTFAAPAAGLQSGGLETTHEEEKTALVAAGIAVGLVAHLQ